MIKFIKHKLKIRRLEKDLNGFFEPRKEFLENSKSVFLSALSEKTKFAFLAKQPLPFYKSFLRYGVSAVAAFSFLATGLVAYADKQDVKATSPLYGFKRLGEEIQLKLASGNQKALLYEKFAERRLREIQKAQEIQVDHEQEKIDTVKELKEKLRDDFQKKIEGIEENIKADKEPLFNLCEPQPQILNGDSESFWEKSEKLSKFKERCEKLKEKDRQELEELAEASLPKIDIEENLEREIKDDFKNFNESDLFNGDTENDSERSKDFPEKNKIRIDD